MTEKEPNPRTRLIDHMADLASEGFHCGNCIGTCCTSVANSMRITHREAEDIFAFLQSEDRVGSPLRQELESCITKYSLDDLPGDGQRAFLRRSYTCPFFERGARGRGCTIAPESKPFGCLAFNAREPGVTEGGNCRSNQSLLQEVEADAGVAENEVRWPIPVAVLKVMEAQSRITFPAPSHDQATKPSSQGPQRIQ